MADAPQPFGWEKVVVFISSTFSDMHAERDYLVKRVFPELQDWCERRKLRLVDIDLRWGVTEQDASSKRAVKVCLERINECRPFFLCFLGQRHGWTPGAAGIDDDTFDEFPDLLDALHPAASVTELEIRHAILKPFASRDTKDRKRLIEYQPSEWAFFYFRDSAYLASMPETPQQLSYTYSDESGPDDETDSERDHRELSRQAAKALRQSIVTTAEPTRRLLFGAAWRAELRTPELTMSLECSSVEETNVRRWRDDWNRFAHLNLAEADLRVPETLHVPEAKRAAADQYNVSLTRGRLSEFQSLEETRGMFPPGANLAHIIQYDLKQAIQARYYDHTEVASETELQKEIDQQEQFLFSASEGFIMREGDFADLDDYVDSGSNKLFVLTALGGMGKSILLANWVDRYRKQIKAGVEGHADHSIHFRFIGQSDGTTTAYSLLTWLLSEIKEVARKLDEEVPLDPVKLRNEWPALLEAIGKRGKTVIVIDALNQLESGLTDVGWLPRQLPDNIKMIVSFKRDDPAAEELYERFSQDNQVTLSEVKPFERRKHRRKLVKAYLSQYLKDLDKTQREFLINLPGARNPLYLKVVLSELRVFGAYANLAAKIHSDFGDNPISAFVGVLRRLENDPAYSRIHPTQAVPLLFGLLAHARRGLSADELTSLFIQALELEDTAEAQEAAADTVNLFLRQVRSFLARREGRYDFFFESFRIAAQQRYVGEADEDTIAKRSYQEWQRLLASYFQSLPTWRDVADSSGAEPARQPTLRKVAELPYHLTQGELWEGLEGTLCDLDFVEAKCATGRTYDLVTDFEIAEEVAPTALSEGQRWRQWKQFVNLQATNFERFLAKHPILVFQQAFNGSPDGLVAQAARERLVQGRAPESRWIERRNRPEHFVESACDRAYTSRGLQFEAISRSTAVSALPDHSLSIWSLGTGKTIARSLPLQSPVARIRSTESGTLVTCLEDGTISVWNPTTAEVTHSWKTGLEKPALELREDVLLWSSIDGKDFAVTMVDLATNVPAVWFRGHHGSVRQITLLDEQFMATTSADRALRVWHRQSGALARTIPGHGEGDTQYVIIPPRCAISYVTPAGVLSTHKQSEPALLVWDLDTGLCIRRLATRNTRVNSVYSINSGSMACVQGDRATEVWDPRAGRLLYTIAALGDSGELLALTSDTGRGLFRLNEHQLLLWNFALAALERRFNARDVCAPVRLMDSGLLIAASRTQPPKVWDFTTGRHLGALAGHAGRVDYVKVFDNRSLISKAADSSVRVWNVGRMRSQASAAGREVAGTQPILLGARQAAVLNGNVIQVWDLASGVLLHILAGHSAEVRWVGSTSRGRIVSTGADDTLRVWDPRSGRCLAVLSGHDDEITATVIMGDEKAVTGSADGTCRVWDLVEGRCLHVLGSGGRVNRMAAIPDVPSSILAVHADRRLRAWDIECGECWSDIRLGIHIDHFVVLRGAKVLVVGALFEELGRLQVCDLKSSSVQTLLEGMEPVAAMISGDQGLVITAGLFGRIRVWHPETGSCRYSLRPPEPTFHHAIKLKVLPNGQLLASCNDGVRSWNLETGEYGGLRSDPFEVLAEACAATENGVEWLGDLYPLSGKPKVVATESHAVLTEEQSGIVHILHLRGPVGDSERDADTSLIEIPADVSHPVAEKTVMSAAELAILALQTTRTLIEAGDVDGALLGLRRAEVLLLESSSRGLALRCLVESCLVSRRNSRRLEPSMVERLVMSLDDPRLEAAAWDAESGVLGSKPDSPEASVLKRIQQLVALGAPPSLSYLFHSGRDQQAREVSFRETGVSLMAGTRQMSGGELADTIDQARAILADLASEDTDVHAGVPSRDDSIGMIANRAIALVGLGRFTEAQPLLIEAERFARLERRDVLPLLLRIHARSLLDASANPRTAIELLEEAASMIAATAETADWVRTTDELVRAHRLLGDRPALIACLDRRIAETRTLGLHQVMLASLVDKVALLTDSLDSLPLLDEIEQLGLETGELSYVYSARANRAMLRSELLAEHGQAIAPLQDARKGLRRLGAVQTVAQCDAMLRIIRERVATHRQTLEREAEAALDSGNADAVLEKINERVELCHHASEYEELAKALVERAYVLHQFGRSGEAQPALAEARRIANDRDLPEILERVVALGG